MRQRLVAAALASIVLAFGGCAEPEGAPASAPSNVPPGSASDAEIEAEAARFLAFAKVNNVAFPTRQHLGGAMVDVYVNPTAEESYRAVTSGSFPKGRAFPPGSMLVKAMAEPDGTILTVMYKKAEGYDSANRDWWFGRLFERGRPTDAAFVGKVDFCISCHAGAAETDRAWGIPAAAR